MTGRGPSAGNVTRGLLAGIAGMVTTALAILIVAGAAAGSPSPVNGSTTPPAAGPTAAAAGAVPTTTGLPPATTAVTPTRTRSRSTPPRTAASVVARHGSDRPCPHSDSTMPGDDA